MMTMITAQ